MLYDKNGIFTGEEDFSEDQKLMHYGTPRHSGRYPWGSGDNPYQRNADFIGQVQKLKKQGVKEKDIAKGMGMNTSELRKRISLANAENRAYLSSEAKRLKAKGMSTSAIARRMGRNESSVRLLLDEGVNERMSSTAKNAVILKDRLDDIPYIQVGKGVETQLGISSHSLGNALKMLENEGYVIENIPVEQLGTGKTTMVKVLAKPGTEWKDIMKNQDKIGMVKDVYSEDGGETMRAFEPPVSVDPKRVMINYAETGGKDKDGVIELRRDVDDISLNRANYAQVRILVDDTHYLKGMAMYADDLPDGVDIRFNTNKHQGTPMIDKNDPDNSVLKPVKEELENPFGANILPEEKIRRAQRHYTDADGNEQLSALNIVSEEGTWNDWNRTLASQFLSKQSPALAKNQLKMQYDIAKSDFDEIASYENPTVKAKMLEDFAGRCDHDAVHLAAAALPRQSTRVILPLTNIKENEIYAPGYKDGEQVALVRYPHGSIHEIPILTVNNNNKLAKSTIGDSIDAVGIHSKAAEQLSGADFDGDTVLVLPTSNVKIKSKPQFEKLKDFDPKEAYPAYPGMHVMTDHEKGLEMGKVSNLITDMTIRGATDDEICRAIRHSMVVIDAKKHKLNYKQSEIDNGIAELKAKYQTGGASTFLSRSTSDWHVGERKEKAFSKMTPEEKERYLNGEVVWEYTGKTKQRSQFPLSMMTKEEKIAWKSGDPAAKYEVKKAMYADGRVKKKEYDVTTKVDKGYEFDPYDLVSGGSREATTTIERIYADHAVAMKELAREARKLARAQKDIEYSPEAKQKYAKEVESLDAKLYLARANAPLEKQAQLIANQKLRSIFWNNPDMDDEHRKREKGRQLDRARKQVGAQKKVIGTKDNPLTDREWEAIQAGAISKTKLKQILDNSDGARIRELALPKTKTGLPSAKLAMAKSMLAKGYTRAEICERLDISEGKLINAIGIENL